jgi:hypothetical protein
MAKANANAATKRNIDRLSVTCHGSRHVARSPIAVTGRAFGSRNRRYVVFEEGGNMFELPSEEREYLIETLREAHTQLLHQMHHADTNGYRNILREQLTVNERLLAKLEIPALVG